MSTRGPVRAVLVNYRSADLIEQRLRSGVFEASDEVVIVDNGSDPERVAAWKSAFGVIPVLLPDNRGYAAGVNAGLRSTTTAAPVLLLNPDAELGPGELTALLAQLDGTTDGVAPVLVGSDGRVQVGSAGGPLNLRAVVAYFWFVSAALPALRGVFLTRRQLAAGTAADWLCMACLLVAPDAFTRFGPVPEDELVYAEDLAWGTDATRRGARFRLVPQVRVRHEQGASGGSAAWTGALERLLRRRLGAVRGALATGVVRSGLGLRRVLRRGLRRGHP